LAVAAAKGKNLPPDVFFEKTEQQDS